MPNDLKAELASKARFVFQGTVLKIKSANVAEVTDTSGTVVVRADRVLQAPKAFQGYAGQEITVKLAPGETVKAGDTAVFYTNGWIMGQKAIAVQSVGHGPPEGVPQPLRATATTPHDNLADKELQDRLASADVVVAGKVSSIHLPETLQASPALLGAVGTTPRRRITEHDPEWRDAVIDVADTHKGDPGTKSVAIRFPSSNDVRWFNAPKFYPGQEGVFILHKVRSAKEEKPLRMGMVTEHEAGSPEAYTALHPADFQPIQKHAEIKQMVTGLVEPGQK